MPAYCELPENPFEPALRLVATHPLSSFCETKQPPKQPPPSAKPARSAKGSAKGKAKKEAQPAAVPAPAAKAESSPPAASPGHAESGRSSPPWRRPQDSPVDRREAEKMKAYMRQIEAAEAAERERARRRAQREASAAGDPCACGRAHGRKLSMRLSSGGREREGNLLPHGGHVGDTSVPRPQVDRSVRSALARGRSLRRPRCARPRSSRLRRRSLTTLWPTLLRRAE